MPFPSKYCTPVPMVDCQRMSREQWYSRRHDSRAEIRDLRSRLTKMSDPGYNGSTQSRFLSFCHGLSSTSLVSRLTGTLGRLVASGMMPV